MSKATSPLYDEDINKRNRGFSKQQSGGFCGSGALSYWWLERKER